MDNYQEVNSLKVFRAPGCEKKQNKQELKACVISDKNASAEVEVKHASPSAPFDFALKARAREKLLHFRIG